MALLSVPQRKAGAGRGRLARPVLGIVLALAVGAAASACHRPDPVPPPPAPAVFTMVARMQPEPMISRRGSVTAGARLKLGFNVPGVLAMLKVKPGDVVRKGELLARLKDGGASAALRSAQANRAKAARDYGTARKLAESGSLPTTQKSDARSMLEIASANSSLAAESVTQRRLISPISGTVLQRLVEPGEAVGPGMPVLVVDETDRLVVKVGVTERELARVKPNQTALLLGATGSAPVPAYVTSVAPAPLEDGLYAVELSPTEEQPAKEVFRPGTLVTVQFDEPVQASKMRIPIDAVVHREGKTLVFVVTGQGDQARAKAREVTIDRVDAKDVVVQSGLTDGESIIREGGYFLQDGQPIRVLPSGPK